MEIEEDWLSFFQMKPHDGQQFHKTRILRFVRKEVFFAAYGTPHNIITHYENTTSSSDAFAGVALDLPFDLTTKSTYMGQAIMGVQGRIAIQQILFLMKKLVVDTHLSLLPADWDYYVNGYGRARITLWRFLEKTRHHYEATFNRKDVTLADVMLTEEIDKAMYIYNPGWKNVSGDARYGLIMNKDLFQFLRKDPVRWNSSIMGNKDPGGFSETVFDPLAKFYLQNGVIQMPMVFVSLSLTLPPSTHPNSQGHAAARVQDGQSPAAGGPPKHLVLRMAAARSVSRRRLHVVR